MYYSYAIIIIIISTTTARNRSRLPVKYPPKLFTPSDLLWNLDFLQSSKRPQPPKFRSLNRSLSFKSQTRYSSGYLLLAILCEFPAHHILANLISLIVSINFRFSPCIFKVNHFYWPINALKCIKLKG